MKDSIASICKDIEKARGEITSPADSAILDICERLARRIAAQKATLTRKIESLDRARPQTHEHEQRDFKMNSGSTSNSPDYKSEKFSVFLSEQMKDPEFAAAYKEISDKEDRIFAERPRLEREVVEATKTERMRQRVYLDNVTIQNVSRFYDAQAQRERAVDALLAFEAEQEKK